jgi:hypothetical protein
VWRDWVPVGDDWVLEHVDTTLIEWCLSHAGTSANFGKGSYVPERRSDVESLVVSISRHSDKHAKTAAATDAPEDKASLAEAIRAVAMAARATAALWPAASAPELQIRPTKRCKVE